MLNPVSGVVADRFDRNVMICGDLFSFGLVYMLICFGGGTGDPANIYWGNR